MAFQCNQILMFLLNNGREAGLTDGMVWTSINLFCLKNNENIGKMFKMNFVRTLEIKQRLATIQGAFIQEKLLILGKSSKAMVFELPSHSIQFHVSLKNQYPDDPVAVKTANLAATIGNRPGLRFLKMSKP